ncbi:hypothetical protein BGZ95_011055 [Linnemannia exigua]|uniref:Uncharacterized protein n=1 Tax=Linnemannia exigua TaxID=604196 RepID=A0AAD4DAI7_9FUNG|nr:hypothetical protein BGZ95_011055 [Linnemannia exigua]
MNQDFRQRSVAWKAIADCYTKEVSRRLNVEELTVLIETLAKDFTYGDPKPAETTDPATKRALSQSGIDGYEDEGSEDDEDQVTEHEDHGGITITDTHDAAENENIDEEGAVRIQGVKKPNQEDEHEESGDDEVEDINVHEYDVQPTTTPEQETALPKPDTVAPAPAPAPAPASVQGQPITLPRPGTVSNADATNVQSMQARPSLGFAEFCQQGHCCGSAKISDKEVIGLTGGKGLTPCAASMSVLVFGAKGVWGQIDESTIKESQSLVWQVDLARQQRP